MPCVILTTNVSLAGVNTEELSTLLIKKVASILAKPESLVMVLLKGSVPIMFGMSKDPAGYVELIAMGGITLAVKRTLIHEVSTIVESKLSIPTTRYFCNVQDATVGRPKL